MRSILPTVLVLVGCLHQTQAADQRTIVGKTVEEWIEVFRDSTRPEHERSKAAWALCCFGKDAKAVVPDLIAALRAGQFQDEAIAILAENEVDTEVTVPLLIERFLKQGSRPTSTGRMSFLGNAK
jgi:hypothetical protein